MPLFSHCSVVRLGTLVCRKAPYNRLRQLQFGPNTVKRGNREDDDESERKTGNHGGAPLKRIRERRMTEYGKRRRGSRAEEKRNRGGQSALEAHFFNAKAGLIFKI